jgi:ABC-type Zn uptake system ZnuABC Zn-binding protein ZnuA
MSAVLTRVLVAGALVVLAVVPAATAPSQERLRVLATLPDLWSITRALVGDLGEVQVATRPGQNPHDLEIRPSQILLVKRAEILVRNGLDEDAWIDPVIESSGNPRRLRGSSSVVEAVRGLALLKVRTIDSSSATSTPPAIRTSRWIPAPLRSSGRTSWPGSAGWGPT